MVVSITNGNVEKNLFMNLDDIKMDKLSPKVRVEYARLKIMEFFYNKITNKLIDEMLKQKVYAAAHDVVYSISDDLLCNLSAESISIIVHYVSYECKIRGLLFDRNELATILNTIKALTT